MMVTLFNPMIHAVDTYTPPSTYSPNQKPTKEINTPLIQQLFSSFSPFSTQQVASIVREGTNFKELSPSTKKKICDQIDRTGEDLLELYKFFTGNLIDSYYLRSKEKTCTTQWFESSFQELYPASCIMTNFTLNARFPEIEYQVEQANSTDCVILSKNSPPSSQPNQLSQKIVVIYTENLQFLKQCFSELNQKRSLSNDTCLPMGMFERDLMKYNATFYQRKNWIVFKYQFLDENCPSLDERWKSNAILIISCTSAALTTIYLAFCTINATCNKCKRTQNQSAYTDI